MAEKTNLVLISVVAIVAIVVMVLLFNGNITGASVVEEDDDDDDDRRGGIRTIHLAADKACLDACGKQPRPIGSPEWIEWHQCRVDCDPKIDLLHELIGEGGGVTFNCVDSDGNNVFQDGVATLLANGVAIVSLPDVCIGKELHQGAIVRLAEALEAVCTPLGELKYVKVICPTNAGCAPGTNSCQAVIAD